MNTAPPPSNAQPVWHRWNSHIDTLRAAIALRAGKPASEAASAHARRIMLDTLGCALAGRLAPEVAALEAQGAALEPGEFRFPGGAALGMRTGTTVLAAAPTWYEACEGHAFAHGRPGIATLAALWPLALRRDATVGQLTDAYVLGYEVGARAGGWLRLAPGIHADGNWPGLGVAAGVAELLGLPADRIAAAVDIAACQLPASLYLPIRTGRSVRNIYLAHSATLGLDAAHAAQGGIEAPPDALGWYAEHCCAASTDPPPLPDAELMLQAYLKPLAAVRHVHYGAIAADRIRRRLQDQHTSTVRSLVLTVYEEATVYCGNPQPQTPLAAQFSLTFGIAAMLRFGAINAESYRAPRFDDPELRRLERLVQVRVDPLLTATRRRGGQVQAVLADGTMLEESVGQDDPALLLDDHAMREKFAANAAPGIAEPQSRAFCAALLGADAAQPLAGVWSRLSA